MFQFSWPQFGSEDLLWEIKAHHPADELTFVVWLAR